MAGSSYGNPIVIQPNRDPLRMSRVELTGSEYNEAFIQNLAFEHPQCLPISEIDRAYENPIPVCIELATPAGYVDALYVTPTGRIIIAESKLWRNPEARRKVVSQILDYAKDFSTWDYDELLRRVRKNLGRKGNVLFDLVSEHYPDVDEARFVDEIEQSLRRGRFLLLIIGDGIRRGAGDITDFLGNVGSLEFTFGLVELGIYRHDSIGTLVQPRVVAKTVELSRFVVELPPGATMSDAQAIEREETTEVSEDAKWNHDYWSELLDGLSFDDPSQPLANPTYTHNIYFKISQSFNASWFSAYLSKRHNYAGVYLRLSKQSFGDSAFESLLEERDAIEEELGVKAEWKSRDKTYSIGFSKQFPSVIDDAHRVEVIEFQRDMLNNFVNTLRGRVLDLADDAS